MAKITLSNGAIFEGTPQECALFTQAYASMPQVSSESKTVHKAKVTKSTKSTDTKSTKATPASTPTPSRDIIWVRDGKFITYTFSDGSFVFIKAIREVLNTRIKSAEGVWNNDVKAWEFTSAKSATAFAKTSTDVTDEEIKAIHDKWAERKARRELVASEKANTKKDSKKSK